MAGLVGGDSDSSALTESGDEPMEVDVGSARQSRRNSVMTGTPTEPAEDEDEDADLPAGGSPGAHYYSKTAWTQSSFIFTSEYSREEG